MRSPSRSNCAANTSFLGSSLTAAMIGPALRAPICLPTYNELANLERMVRTLLPLLREGDRILVIDDGSPDGTGELADRLPAGVGLGGALPGPLKEGLRPAAPG